ncbi:MAG: hypothetical protein J6Z43_07165 [Clostridiales bacterium]|nr:hypothetical protein [Clostridiales bacterium]
MSEEQKKVNSEELGKVAGGVGFGEKPACPTCGGKDVSYQGGHDDMDFFYCNRCMKKFQA